MEEFNATEQSPKMKEIVEPSYPSKNVVVTGNPRIRRFVSRNGGDAPDAAANGEVEAGQPPPPPHQQDLSSGRERLKRHREEVAGRVSIPDNWGQEGFLRDWIDCKAFDALLAPKGIDSAREALVAEGRLAVVATASRRQRIEGRC